MLKNKSLPFLLLKFWKYFSRKNKLQLLKYFFVISLSSLSEIISVSLVIPLLGIIANEDYLLQNFYIRKFSLLLNLTTKNQIISCLFLTFILVIILTGYHFYLFGILKNFEIDSNTKSSKFFKIINEVPTLLLIIIIFIVIFKPL